MKVIKVFVIVTLIVTAILLGCYCMIGDEVTLSTFSQTLEISAIASAVVVIIWSFIGYWVCVPFARFLNKTFELMER